jgi:hypothetical protein
MIIDTSALIALLEQEPEAERIARDPHIRADVIGRESGPPNAVLAHENRRVSLIQQVTGITPTAPLGHNVAASYISFD